jgi:hypothetical protein
MPRKSAAIYAPLSIDDRLTLPKHFCDRLSWLLEKGEKTIEAWIYVLEPGRFRLLSDTEVESDTLLEPLRTFVLDSQSLPPTNPSTADSSQEAAAVARLIPVTVEHHRGSWRMLLPEEAAALCPNNCDPRSLAFFMPDGYLEIWYSDFLRNLMQPRWRRSV